MQVRGSRRRVNTAARRSAEMSDPHMRRGSVKAANPSADTGVRSKMRGAGEMRRPADMWRKMRRAAAEMWGSAAAEMWGSATNVRTATAARVRATAAARMSTAAGMRRSASGRCGQE